MTKPGIRTPLLNTKLSIPLARPALVIRLRLLKLLDSGLQRKLTLVSAPAGFGKTTLVAGWARSSGIPVAWLSLDEKDNDPVLFFSYLFSALNAATGLGELALNELQSPQHPPFSSLLATWINEITRLPRQLLLTLDDYHLIENQAIHDELAYLLANLPSNLHLILIARADPPVPLARLRGLGQLVEIREAQLRFLESEAGEFFQSFADLALDQKEVLALHQRTEGWIAGLHLAGLALQGRRDIADFIESFTGGHHFIIDYLTEEVFNRQPDEVKVFLLQTCILERMCAPLCDAVTGNHNSQAMLHLLDRANLFILPLDGEREWYRYHRLFSDLLHKRLQQTSPEAVPALHRRASAWHEQHGLISAAIEHALSACDFERAALLVESSLEATLMRSELTTLLKWMERLPDELVRSRPTLCFFHAWAMMMSGSPLAAVEQRIQILAGAQEAQEGGEMMPGRMAALDAYLSLFRADVFRAVELSRQALQQLPEKDRFLRSIMTWILSQASLAEMDPRAGSQMLKEVFQMAQDAGNLLIAVTALCNRAKLQMRQGRLHRAREILQQALQAATGPQGQRLPIASEALFGLGELEREWNNLEKAGEYLAESIELYRQWSEMASFDAYFPLARLRLAQGDVDGARQAIETACRIAQSSDSTDLDDVIADLQQAYFLIMLGDAAGAMHWANKRGLVPVVLLKKQSAIEEGLDYISDRVRKYEHLVLARLFILQERAVEALDLLDALLGLARGLKRIDLIIETQILRALAFQRAGQNARAIEALSEALSLAEPGGYMRIFLDEGNAMIRLLQKAASQGIAPAYVSKLLAISGGLEPGEQAAALSHRTRTLPEPISERELEVLRLLASGMSNPEIASELVVAVSTVRTHCKSIYGKLGVHRRWDAVQRARELNLI